MKQFYLMLLGLLFTLQPLRAQFSDNGFICYYQEDTLAMQIRALSDTPKFSGNGNVFTPKGDLRVLVICAGFGSTYDNALAIGDWPSTPDALPNYLTGKSTFYSDTTDFITYAHTEHNQNISRFYYEMSQKKFRLIANVYPKRINIDATGALNWSNITAKVIQKMKQMDPNFDWSPYDQRTNSPGYTFDNSVSAPDKKPDYVVILYRFDKNKNPAPVSGMNGWRGSGGGYSRLDGVSGMAYNGYTFSNNGYTHCDGRTSLFQLFIHEVAHELYHCPHYAFANGVVGSYFYGRMGNGMMSLDGVPFHCALGWERWYLNWVEEIRANSVPADIRTASDLTANGEYLLRDYMATGDMIRIKIPGSGGRNQYLWLENHQKINLFDKRSYLIDGCGTPFPTDQKGVVAYIEAIDDDRINPARATTNVNAIKWFHSVGNYDYDYDTPSSASCESYGNVVYNFREIQPNPISGQNRMEWIRADFDKNNTIYLNPYYNSVTPKNENYPVWMRDSIYTYDRMGHEMAFEAGQTLSMSSNPCLVNISAFNSNTETFAPSVLNGISVQILGYTGGNAKIKIAFNEVVIGHNTRYTGLIHLPDITQNDDPDIVIPAGVTLSIDKSGTPNRISKTAAGDFINPTEFHCLAGSFFKQEAYSNVEVSNGSTFIINGSYEINEQAVLWIRAGSVLQIKRGANLRIQNSGRILVENGGYLCVEPGATIHLQDYNSAINLYETAHEGSNPALSSYSARCAASFGDLVKTGAGCINHLNQDVYIQNETITSDRYITGKNIYVGRSVTASKSTGNVKITNNARVTMDASESVVLDVGFEITKGSVYEILK